jgi:hypothetical protein
MLVNSCVDALGKPSKHLEELAFINARLQTGSKSPLDEALVEILKDQGRKKVLENYQKCDESECRKRKVPIDLNLKHYCSSLRQLPSNAVGFLL